MKTNEIASIVADILYIDDLNDINEERSLFNNYDLSSLDFIDLAFELKSSSGIDFTPNQLWPVSSMMDNPEYYNDGKWTDAGINALREEFSGFADIPEDITLDKLHDLFNILYIEQRLKKIAAMSVES